MNNLQPKAYSYIRFSTPQQLKGDSLRRQLDASRLYAKEHGWILDESLQDLGLSAFHGIHKIKGALGRFLKLVEEGKIEKGSYLLVESLDRLSREEVDDAYDQFRGIIKADIIIVTLQDGMKYSKESIKANWAQLIISITYMARAFDESKRKSQRITTAWENKRTDAVNGGRKMTAKCPSWLKLLPDRMSFIPIPEAEQVINLIFDMKLQGKGSETIAKDLNQSQLWKPPGRKGKLPSWRKSYIDKLLYKNGALIGEFQPYKMVNGRRVKEGEPNLVYYPAIIPIDKYNQVQALIQANRNTNGQGNGRNDKMSNLFGHLAKCSKCGYPMQYLNKGDTSKGGQYLKCDKEIRKIDGGCISKMIHYDIVEDSILTYCLGLQVSDIIPSDNQTITELSELQKRLQSINGELQDIDFRYNSTLDSMETTSNPTMKEDLKHRASAFILRREKLQKEKEDIEKQIIILQSSGKSTEEQINSIKEFISLMKTMEGQERVSLRLNLRNQLRRLIRMIKVDIKEMKLHIEYNTRQSTSIRINKDGTFEKIFDRLRPPIIR
jgi:DNA invertase Pin-like site-specific DNA recombinase